MSQPLTLPLTPALHEDPTENASLGRRADSTMLIRQLIANLGEDPAREGLLGTPGRVDRSLHFLTSGYKADLAEVVNDALFRAEGSETVIVRDIEFYSMCEHHMLPFFGKVHIAYLPNEKVLGLSKFARVVDMFARRLQLQERLTSQVADALVEVLDPRGLVVVANASHLCMMMRGVERQGSTTTTVATRGVLTDDSAQRNGLLRSLDV